MVYQLVNLRKTKFNGHHVIKGNFLNIDNITHSLIMKYSFTSTQPSFNWNVNNLIIKYVTHSTARNDLLTIFEQNKPFSRFEFYTDGSLIDFGTQQCNMTCGFIQVADTANYSEF